MNRKLKYILAIGIIVWSSSYVFKKMVPRGAITGVYANKNFSKSRVEPSRADTLYLYDDGRLKSKYWGNGKYEIEYEFLSTRIKLINGRDGSYSKSSVIRGWPGKTKIMISSNHSHFYERLPAQ